LLNDSEEIPARFTGIVIWPSGTKLWVSNGMPHRLDGPARECVMDCCHWYVEGKCLTFEQFWEKQKDTEYAPRIMAYMLGVKK
jgi:hypothetical protein